MIIEVLAQQVVDIRTRASACERPNAYDDVVHATKHALFCFQSVARATHATHCALGHVAVCWAGAAQPWRCIVGAGIC